MLRIMFAEVAKRKEGDGAKKEEMCAGQHWKTRTQLAFNCSANSSSGQWKKKANAKEERKIIQTHN